ncbi:MAG: hypothetical protein LC808_26090 [Actinobacteria bacterium]|nr:hypothetical protein [Actinomycetota bacterium]
MSSESQRTTMVLDVGRSATFRVKARSKWNVTDLLLIEGCRYDFRASGRWVDLIKKTDPDGYTSQFFTLRLTESRRRSPNENWFCLIGAINRDPTRQFALGARRSLTMPASGRLTTFANDLPFMYWNNFGSLTLTITRIE